MQETLLKKITSNIKIMSTDQWSYAIITIIHENLFPLTTFIALSNENNLLKSTKQGTHNAHRLLYFGARTSFSDSFPPS